MQSSIFFVNSEPYCITEVDLRERTNQFLDGIDLEYYSYLLKSHIDADEENKIRASIAIRNAYYHSLETLFSLLGSLIQAPHCPYAWIGKYKNNNLRAVVEQVNKGSATLKTLFKVEYVNWEVVSEIVFTHIDQSSSKWKKLIKKYAELWARLSREFLNKNHIDEYNSIKHGFRIASGGFGLSIGLQKEYGVQAAPEDMRVIGHSEYGSTFFRLSRIGDNKQNRNIKSKRVSLNWELEKTAMLLQLIECSIENGASPSKTKFLNPEDLEFFDQAWKYSSGVSSSNFDFVLDESNIPDQSKADLLKKFDEMS